MISIEQVAIVLDYLENLNKDIYLTIDNTTFIDDPITLDKINRYIGRTDVTRVIINNSKNMSATIKHRSGKVTLIGRTQ